MLEEMFDHVVLDLVAGCTARLVGGFFFPDVYQQDLVGVCSIFVGGVIV